jgi:N-methylhydantoinase A
VGQGHEVEVTLPVRALTVDDARELTGTFDSTYSKLYGRTIPNMDVEVLTFALSLSARLADSKAVVPARADDGGEPSGQRAVLDLDLADYQDAAVYARDRIGAKGIPGPAVVVEQQTTTVVPRGFVATAGVDGALELLRAD